MKPHYSTAELSKILDISGRAVGKRANNKGWKFITINGKRHYLFESLPKEDRRIILSHQTGLHIDLIPLKNITAKHVEACQKKWNSAPEYSQHAALAKHWILNEIDKKIQTEDLNKGQAEERFVSFYNARLIQNIPPLVLDKIPEIGVSTTRTWRRERKKHALAGLLTEYGNRKGKRLERYPEIKIYISDKIKEIPHLRPKHIYKMICKVFKHLEHLPSESSVCRYVQDWKKENQQLYTIIKNPSEWKNKYLAAFGDASADVPCYGHSWEIDSSILDVFCKDGKRYAVVLIVDIYSRRVIIHVAPTSNSIDLALAIRKALIAWGIPSRIKTDRGKEYLSGHIQAVCINFDVELIPLLAFSPELKPYAERHIGTLARISELIPGWCGPNVIVRKELREKEVWGEKIFKSDNLTEGRLSPEELQSLLDRFVDEHDRTPHKGLNGRTPLEVARKSRLQPQKIRDEHVLDILLFPAGFRKVQKKGISFDGFYFISPELIEHIGRRVEIRRDLSSAGVLFVFDAHGKYLCLAKNEPLEGIELEKYLEAKKKHLKTLKEQVKAKKKMALSNPTPLQILLEGEIEHDDRSNIINFQANFENPAVEEARKAVLDIDVVDVDEAPDQVSKAVNYYHSTDFLLDDSHLTDSDIDREYEKIKKYRNKRII